MTEKKKLSTAEIMELARKAKASGGGEAPAAPPAGAAPAPAAPESPASEGAAPAPAAPKSTADILAAARAQKKPAAPPAEGAAPKSTADILAAARGQGGGAKPAAPKSTADILAAARANKAGAAPAAKPVEGAAAKPAAKPAAAPVAAADAPPLKEMVAAVKAVQEGKPAVAVKLPGQAKPKLPAKDKVQVSRRAVVLSVIAAPFVIAWSAMTAIAALWGLGTARFMMPNMVLELPSKFPVGVPSDYPPGAVSEKYKASRGVWIVRSSQYNGQDIIYALASVCTHLGCTPNWLEGEQKFKCPCHGSGFYITGINFEGPAPRPLERVGLRRAPNGMLEVDKSIKFQEELGQWSDGKSFFAVS